MIRPTLIDEVINTLTDDAREAISTLDDYYGHGPKHVASALGWPIDRAKSALAELRRDGIAAFGPLFDEYGGDLRGCGYWLDTFGREVKTRLGGVAP